MSPLELWSQTKERRDKENGGVSWESQVNLQTVNLVPNIDNLLNAVIKVTIRIGSVWFYQQIIKCWNPNTAVHVDEMSAGSGPGLGVGLTSL